jgi:hypothetical protein
MRHIRYSFIEAYFFINFFLFSFFDTNNHNISGEVANKFYNDMETPVQIILGPIGSGKTFALQMKIIRLAKLVQVN